MNGGTKTDEILTHPNTTGILKLISNRGFKQLKQKGYRYCMTDWYILNLLSSRFWPKRGFRPVMYRMVRTIDERIAWANGEF